MVPSGARGNAHDVRAFARVVERHVRQAIANQESSTDITRSTILQSTSRLPSGKSG